MTIDRFLIYSWSHSRGQYVNFSPIHYIVKDTANLFPILSCFKFCTVRSNITCAGKSHVIIDEFPKYLHSI